MQLGWAMKIRACQSCLKRGARQRLLYPNIEGLMWLDQGLFH